MDLIQFTRNIISLNRAAGMTNSTFTSDVWLQMFHQNCQMDVNPYLTVEQCKQAVQLVLSE